MFFFRSQHYDVANSELPNLPPIWRLGKYTNITALQLCRLKDAPCFILHNSSNLNAKPRRMPAIRQHIRNSERKKIRFVYTCVIQQHDIIQSVFLYLQTTSVSSGIKLRAGQQKNGRWICGRKRDFNVLCTNYMGSGAHPASYKTNKGLFLKGKVTGNRSWQATLA